MRKRKKIRTKQMTAIVMSTVFVLSGCSSASDANSTSSSGESDSEKAYDISYTGQWCNADYKDGSYVERLIEDALNINLTVEKAETTVICVRRDARLYVVCR